MSPAPLTPFLNTHRSPISCVICHGLHDRMIIKSLFGEKQQPNINVELKECIALGDNFSRHSITKKS